MSKRGENIYKRKDNRWEGRFIKSHDPGGKAKYGYVYAASYREAREKLMKKRAEYQAPRSQTKCLREYSEEWLALQETRLKQSTCSKYRGMLRLHILPVFGDDPISRITALAVERFGYQLMSEQGSKLSPKSGKDVLTLLQAILKYACRQEGASLPLPQIIYPREEKKEIRVLSYEEQTKLVNYCSANMDSLHFGVLLAMLTGMRIGELCALRWGDISEVEGTVSVSKTMQRIQIDEGLQSRTKIVVDLPKSDTSKRLIPLTEHARFLCEKYRVPNPDAYVLTGSVNQFVEPRLMQYHLKQFAKECGVKELHFHALRHTFATRCIEVGVEMKSLSEILGHSSIKITMDRYVHSSLAFKRENIQKLSAIGM